MKERIRLIMENAHLTPSAFADNLQVGRAVISHILNGRNNPSLDIVIRILSKMTYIDPEWLLTGKGEMRKQDNKTVDEKNIQPIQSKSSVNTNSVNANSNINSNISSDLFSENPIYPINGADGKKYEQENELISPVFRDKSIENKDAIYDKPADRKVRRIIIYYSDNTFESFISDKESL